MPFICMLFEACNQLSISAAEAHKMTVMTLEDHSSKGWSHHQCHARRSDASVLPLPPHFHLQLPRLLPLLHLPLLRLPSSVSSSSVSSFSSVFELRTTRVFLYMRGLSSLSPIRHISVGALLCLLR